ncbi:MAG: glutamine amidotransferase [Clostridia bacterium]|nr:glutamine amidotransferase [Clostridia bacterium]
MNIKVLHLYHDILNLYGDYGNVVILKKHIEDQGNTVTLEKKSIGEEYDPNNYNFVYIGAGTERGLDRVLKDIKLHKEQFKKFIDDRKYILATGNSFEMFGKKIEEEEALNIFDYEVQRDKDRKTSDIIYSSEYLKGKVVGFVNKSTRVYHNMNPFFKVEFGIGENEKNDYEGVKYKNFYGTHISGPILARNPELLQTLVLGMCKDLSRDFKPKKIDYTNEQRGYELVLEELTKRAEGK